MTKRKTGRSSAAPAPRRKKAYKTPKLVEYGTVSKLSAAKPGSISDGSNSILML